MAKRKPLTFDNKGLSDDLKASTGQGVDALFSPTPVATPMVKKRKLLMSEGETPNHSETKPPKKTKTIKTKVRNSETKQATEQPRNRDAMKPRNHATTVSRYHDTIIEAVRKAVKELGKEAATHRFTIEEKKALSDIIYTYKNRSIKTSENEITRIAVNYILSDYRESGKGSILNRVLQVLNG